MQKLILTSLAVGLSAGLLARPVVPRKVQGVDYESLYLQNHRTTTATAIEFEDNPNPLSSEGSFTFDDITNWTGTGKNRAALVIQWNDDREGYAMVFGYRWDGEATGVQMLRDVTEANPRLYSLIQYTGVSSAVDPNGGFTVCGIGWDFDQDRDIFLIDNGHGGQTYESESGLFLHPRGIDSVSSPSYDYDSWLVGDTDDFWGAGWFKSYWSYWVRSASDGEFKYSNVGVSGRLLSDGCWDGWNFKKGMSTYEWKPLVAAPVITDDEIFTAGGLCYRILSPEFKTAAVIAPVGDDSAYAGEVVVPACVQYGDDVYEVTSVEAEAFKGSTVTNVIISAGSRLDIGKYAFASIPTLTRIVVNGDGSQLRLEEGAFSACPLLERVEISDSSDIVRIGDSLFMGCVSLTEEGIPSVLWDVDIIPENMYASTGITRLDIERAQEIGEGAFAGCADLASLTLGSKVVRIGDRAFAGDDALAEVIVRFVNIPDINSNVFAEWVYCSAELSVPYTTADSFRSKETWKEFAYIRERDFELLPGVIVSSGDINYKICEGDGLYLAVSHKEYTGIPEIPAYVEIDGESYPVKAIGESGLGGCKVTFRQASALHELGKNAFYYESSGSATYADDLLTMRRDVVYGDGAFRGLSGYTRLKIEEGVQSIPDAMFHSSKVVEIEGGFPESLTYIGNEAFRSTLQLTGPLTIPATVMELGSLAFYFSNLSEGVIIPDDSRLTAVDAFSNTDIPFIHIPDGVKEVGANAFNYCRNLKKVTGMAGVTKIGSSGFSGCSINEICLPEGLEMKDCHSHDWHGGI